jgi:hypothetical protein
MQWFLGSRFLVSGYHFAYRKPISKSGVSVNEKLG